MMYNVYDVYDIYHLSGPNVNPSAVFSTVDPGLKSHSPSVFCAYNEMYDVCIDI